MNPANRKKRFSMNLGLKASLAVITLIVIISGLFTTFFIFYQKRASMEELRKRCFSLASNLAYNSRFAVYSRDFHTLQNLVNGVKRESDIIRAMIVGLEGELLASSDSSSSAGEVSVDSIRSYPGQTWFPSENKDIYRTLSLITAEREITQGDESFLFSPMGKRTDQDKKALRQETLGCVILEVSLANMNEALATTVRKAVFITLVIILAAILIVVYLVRRIVQPVYLLADATKEVARGEFGKVVPVGRSDELGVLANSFNDMSLQLKKSKDDINKLNKELELRVAESTAELLSRHQELERTITHLKSLDAAKDDFLSLVSHELRTPLSSIQMFSEMLIHGLSKTEKKRADILTTIINNCRRLTRLINDVLDLSKIEAGQIQLDFKGFNLVEAVNQTISSLRPAFESRDIRCVRNFAKKKILVHSDPDKIIQVLINVLSNAVKFSPEKSEVVVSIKEDAEEVVVSVQDFGKGIYQEDIPKVFDKFYQLKNISLTAEGSGLGMSISQLIVEHLGGKIWIESRIRRGTSVFFSLPASK